MSLVWALIVYATGTASTGLFIGFMDGLYRSGDVGEFWKPLDDVDENASFEMAMTILWPLYWALLLAFGLGGLPKWIIAKGRELGTTPTQKETSHD